MCKIQVGVQKVVSSTRASLLHWETKRHPHKILVIIPAGKECAYERLILTVDGLQMDIMLTMSARPFEWSDLRRLLARKEGKALEARRLWMELHNIHGVEARDLRNLWKDNASRNGDWRPDQLHLRVSKGLGLYQHLLKAAWESY